MADRDLIKLGRELTETVFIGVRTRSQTKAEAASAKEKVERNAVEKAKKQKKQTFWLPQRVEELYEAYKKKKTEETTKLVAKLISLAETNTSAVAENLTATKDANIEWRYPDPAGRNPAALPSTVEFVSVRVDDDAIRFENEDQIHTTFTISMKEKTIELDFFYWNQGESDYLVPKYLKEHYPPYMTMYFLQHLADKMGFMIVVPQDLSARSNEGASYYVSNYGFYAPDQEDTQYIRRDPCPQALQSWIENNCTGTLRECFERAYGEQKINGLIEGSCWSKTKDILYNFGSSRTKNMRHEGFLTIYYRGQANGAYSGEIENKKANGQGTVTTRWSTPVYRYTGEFSDGKPHGFGIETGGDGYKLEGYWLKGEYQGLYPPEPGMLPDFDAPSGSEDIPFAFALPLEDTTPDCSTRVTFPLSEIVEGVLAIFAPPGSKIPLFGPFTYNYEANTGEPVLIPVKTGDLLDDLVFLIKEQLGACGVVNSGEEKQERVPGKYANIESVVKIALPNSFLGLGSATRNILSNTFDRTSFRVVLEDDKCSLNLRRGSTEGIVLEFDIDNRGAATRITRIVSHNAANVLLSVDPQKSGYEFFTPDDLRRYVKLYPTPASRKGHNLISSQLRTYP